MWRLFITDERFEITTKASKSLMGKDEQHAMPDGSFSWEMETIAWIPEVIAPGW